MSMEEIYWTKLKESVEPSRSAFLEKIRENKIKINNKIKSKNNRNLVLLISSFAIQKQGLRENGFRADQRDLGPMFWFNMSS